MVLLQYLMITGKTKIVGIFGDPIEHTLSPLIHNTAFKELGLDYCYVPFHVKKEKLKEAVSAIRALNIRGVNITVPHKESVIQYLDEVSEEAKYIGAVNTILNDEGILRGFNTDTKGFIMSLKEQKVPIKDKNILVLGAGGAAKAIIYGILKENGRVYIFNRTVSKAYKIKDSFNNLGQIEIVEKIDSSLMHKINIIVNATSLGLKKNDPMPINPNLLKNKHIYYDVIYPQTPLMKEAEKIGCKVIGGMGMLLYQAFLAFEIWTNQKPSEKIFRKIKKTIDKY